MWYLIDFLQKISAQNKPSVALELRVRAEKSLCVCRSQFVVNFVNFVFVNGFGAQWACWISLVSLKGSMPTINDLKWRSPIFEKKMSWPKFGPKLGPKWGFWPISAKIPTSDANIQSCGCCWCLSLVKVFDCYWEDTRRTRPELDRRLKAPVWVFSCCFEINMVIVK